MDEFTSENYYFGEETYECYGSCVCDEDGRRRGAIQGGRVIRGMRFAVAAFSSLLAIRQAKKYFNDECLKKYDGFCSDPSNVHSEVDDCVHMETRGSKEHTGGKTDIFGDSSSSSCSERCGEEVFGEKEDEEICWCDSLCVSVNDCCHDFEEECSDYSEAKKKKMPTKKVKDFVGNKMKYVSQACVRIRSDSGEVIYTDPYQTSEDSHDADVILITHKHYDHWSPEDCERLLKEDTTFVVPSSFSDEVETTFPDHEVISMGTMDERRISDDISIETVPAYNTENKEFHPKSEGWVGYVINLKKNGLRIFHAGDTNRIPEMKNIDPDISLLPLGPTYTMDSADEAVLAARDTGCTVAVPMHYGLYEGDDSDLESFQEGCGKLGIDVFDLKNAEEKK